MTCHNCQLKAVKAGKDRKGNQRYRCDRCKRRFQAEREKLLGNMYLSEEKALLILQLLVEGNSIRSIERVTGCEKKTICTLLNVAGERCEDLMKRIFFFNHTATIQIYTLSLHDALPGGVAGSSPLAGLVVGGG